MAVKYDTVIALEELWRAIWAEFLVGWSCTDWKEARNPDNLWEEQSFWLTHERSGHAFWTAVALERPLDGISPRVRLYCSLMRERDDLEMLEDDLPGFETTGDDEQWPNWIRMVSSVAIPPQGVADISELRAAAAGVYKAVQQFIG